VKIEYTLTSSESWVVLMDDTAGDTLEPWEPDYRAHARVEELASNVAQGASVFTGVLGNIRCELALRQLCKTYSTRAAAMAASRTIPTTFLNAQVHLKVTEGAEIQFFPFAVTNHCKPNVQGASVVFEINLTTQLVTATSPFS
jgi:hypothetical protein